MMMLLETPADYIASGEEAIQQTTGLFATMLEQFVAFLPTLVVALVVFIIGMLLAKLLSKVVHFAIKRAKLQGTATSFGHSLGRILLYTLLIIICLSIAGVPMTSIITVVGAAGLAVGLALQNSLSNVAGGFIILFAKLFAVGDYIIVGDKEGYVESVSILYTQLTALDNRTIYIANGTISSGGVINLTKRGTVRVETPLSISYQADVSEARKVLLKAVGMEKMVQQKPTAFVSMTEHGESGISLSLYAWVKAEDYFAAKARLLEVSKKALDEAGIEIPYPQICVHTK